MYESRRCTHLGLMDERLKLLPKLCLKVIFFERFSKAISGKCLGQNFWKRLISIVTCPKFSFGDSSKFKSSHLKIIEIFCFPTWNIHAKSSATNVSVKKFATH